MPQFSVIPQIVSWNGITVVLATNDDGTAYLQITKDTWDSLLWLDFKDGQVIKIDGSPVESLLGVGHKPIAIEPFEDRSDLRRIQGFARNIVITGPQILYEGRGASLPLDSAAYRDREAWIDCTGILDTPNLEPQPAPPLDSSQEIADLENTSKPVGVLAALSLE